MKWMKWKTIPIVATAFLSGTLTTSAPAAASGDAIIRASLWDHGDIPELTVGADHERMYRAVKVSGTRTRNLEVESNSVYLGWGIAPWLQGFGTAGYAQVKRVNRDAWGDGFFRGRLGLAAHLWRAEIPAPDFMKGAVSLRAAADYGYGRFNDDVDAGHWHDASVSATAHYEILAEERPGRTSYPYSMDLYAGPIAQWISGEWDVEGARRNIEQDRLVGLAFGANVFMTPRFSLGAHLRLFDTFGWRASLRLAF